jgi:hypothetical protein
MFIDIYEKMIDDDETWFFWAYGCAIIICDVSLMDC